MMTERVNTDIVKIENARIIFRNFEGRASEFNRAGDRNFCVVIEDADVAQQMREDGWNIRIRQPRDEGDTPFHYLNVKVSFERRPPTIRLVTRKGVTDITEDDIGELDHIDIKNVDLAIRPYHWDVSGKTGIKAYLKTMYVTAEEDEFGDKYDSIGDEEMPF